MRERVQGNSSGHSQLTQQKMHEQHDQHIKIMKHQNKPPSLPQNLNFKYQKILFWVPILAGLCFITLGIIRQTLKQQQKFYCYKRAFKPTPFNWPPKQQASRDVLINTRYKSQIYVDGFDKNVSKMIAESGSYQPNFVALIGHIVKIGDNVVVVGGHYGLEAVVIGNVVDKKGKLFVFQPYTYRNQLLNKTLHLNKLNDRTKILRIQPSNRPQKQTAQTIQSMSIQSSPSSPNLSQQYSYRSQTLQLQTIDSQIPSDIKIDFAYINLQKNGVKALMGMKNIIKRSQNLVILIKWQSSQKGGIKNQGEEIEIMRILEQRGYKSYSYKGGSFRQACEVGEFILRGSIDKEFNIKQEMLVFFPEGYSLPI